MLFIGQSNGDFDNRVLQLEVAQRASRSDRDLRSALFAGKTGTSRLNRNASFAPDEVLGHVSRFALVLSLLENFMYVQSRSVNDAFEPFVQAFVRLLPLLKRQQHSWRQCHPRLQHAAGVEIIASQGCGMRGFVLLVCRPSLRTR